MSEYMLFCLGGEDSRKGEGYQKSNRIFNVDVSHDKYMEARQSLPTLNLGITKWTDKKDMTKEEKNSVSSWETRGGYLKRYTYEEAWATTWDKLSNSDRQKFLDLPHFDAEIFEAITGIDVEVAEAPKTINVGGKEYEVTPELTKALEDLKEVKKGKK